MFQKINGKLKLVPNAKQQKTYLIFNTEMISYSQRRICTKRQEWLKGEKRRSTSTKDCYRRNYSSERSYQQLYM